MGWKDDAVRMRLDEARPWREIAEALIGNFPGKDIHQAIGKIRVAVKRSERYKAEHAKKEEPRTETEPESKSTYRDSWTEDKIKGEGYSDRLIEICEGKLLTDEDILLAHHLDPEIWNVVVYTNNLWHSQTKLAQRLLMYQSKLTVKRKLDGISFKGIAEAFKKLDREYACPTPILLPREARLMAEVNIADLHLSKLCWHGDTPGNFDHKIARDMYYTILAEIVEDLRGKELEYLTFVWPNDFFNIDTIAQTTTAGTPQDADVRWQKMYNVGCEMLIGGIDLLSRMGADKPRVKVKTFYTPSNHDEVNGYHALQHLAAWFRHDPNIEINIDAYPRKYQLYGNTLIGYGHGDKEGGNGTKDRASRLASMMPIEVPELWGQSRFREFHAGHLHSEHAIMEINGVIVRRISSPTAPDTWHTVSGHLGAVRKAQTFIYDRERGLKQIINTPVA